MSTGSATVVLGLGNPLMGDDGTGLAALERLQEDWRIPPDVDLIDGGTWGMNLLPVVEDADRLLIIDAIRAGERPGEPIYLSREQIPRLFATKLSPHQIDMREVLALAELRGHLPADTVAVGLQPERVEFGEPLSTCVEGNLDRLVGDVVEQLRRWGHDVRKESSSGVE